MAWNSSTLRDVYEARLESLSCCFVLEGSGSGYDPLCFCASPSCLLLLLLTVPPHFQYKSAPYINVY